MLTFSLPVILTSSLLVILSESKDLREKFLSLSKSIIILPEGGRSPDGQIRKFKRGFIYVLRHHKIDLLLITLRGFYNLKPMKRIYLNPDSELEVMIHKPISHSVVESLSDIELVELTVGTIEEAYKP